MKTNHEHKGTLPIDIIVKFYKINSSKITLLFSDTLRGLRQKNTPTMMIMLRYRLFETGSNVTDVS